MQDIDKCKILILGESAVGKTSLLRQFSGNYNGKVTPTIGAEYKQKVIRMANNKDMKVQLWDTAGTERYRTISPIYYRNLDGVLLVFDITDATSFTGLHYWIGELAERGEEAITVLVGNKNDQEERREISVKKAQEKARQLGTVYFQTSALNEQSVSQIFMHLVEKIVEKREKCEGSMIDMQSKKSEFKSLKKTDLPRRGNEESDCC